MFHILEGPELIVELISQVAALAQRLLVRLFAAQFRRGNPEVAVVQVQEAEVDIKSCLLSPPLEFNLPLRDARDEGRDERSQHATKESEPTVAQLLPPSSR